MTKLLLAVGLTVTTLAASGCANTIRGAGADTANTVNATQGAVRRTGNAIAN